MLILLHDSLLLQLKLNSAPFGFWHHLCVTPSPSLHNVDPQLLSAAVFQALLRRMLIFWQREHERGMISCLRTADRCLLNYGVKDTLTTV